MAGETHRRIIPVFESLATEASRGPLGRRFVAKGVRRAQRDARAAGYFLGRNVTGGSTARGQRSWSGSDRSADHRTWNGRAKETVNPEDPQRGVRVEPAL